MKHTISKDSRKREILDRYAARANISRREYEILERFAERAKPPPLLHRYRKPNDFTLAELSKREIFAARPDDLNDPFECSAPVAFDGAALRQRFIEEFAPMKGLSPAQAA